MRRGPAVPAAVLAAVLAAVPALASCSGGGAGGGSDTSRGTSIDITVQDGKVTPNGTRVKVGVGKPVTLHIDSDTAGEIHVHSTPEREIEFPKGTSTRRLTIRQPGIVNVEDHRLDQVIVQLQVG